MNNKKRNMGKSWNAPRA